MTRKDTTLHGRYCACGAMWTGEPDTCPACGADLTPREVVIGPGRGGDPLAGLTPAREIVRAWRERRRD